MSLVIDILSWVLLVVGGFFCCVGAVGLLRMPDFYTRMHAASVIDTLGAGLILIGLALQDMGMHKPVLVMGFEDAFTEHGDPQELMQHYGLTAAGIHQRMAQVWPDFYVTPQLRRVV